MTWEHQYLNLINDILKNGDDRVDRTGVGTRALFGKQLDIDLKAGFPAVTTKKLAWKSVVSELLWFLEGSSDERRLAEILHGTRDSEKSTIWTENAEADYWEPKAQFGGDLGRVYGVQWRTWNRFTKIGEPDEPTYLKTQPVDQVAELIRKLQTNPTDRRMIISAWNVGEIDQMALPPCHMMAQFFVNKRGLSCQMYQRSVDVGLGLPFNIASYALLTHMLAQVVGLEVDRLIMNLGDTHIYKDHIEPMQEQVLRLPSTAPTLKINKDIFDIDGFSMSDFELENYNPQASIKMKMAV
jgi:thymidylate synthase